MPLVPWGALWPPTCSSRCLLSMAACTACSAQSRVAGELARGGDRPECRDTVHGGLLSRPCPSSPSRLLLCSSSGHTASAWATFRVQRGSSGLWPSRDLAGLRVAGPVGFIPARPGKWACTFVMLFKTCHRDSTSSFKSPTASWPPLRRASCGQGRLLSEVGACPPPHSCCSSRPHAPGSELLFRGERWFSPSWSFAL